MVAIFNERISIDYSTNQIENINSIVWAWNTGMSTGQEGAISYNNGSYILAIWAWDWYAEKIAYSSREIPFTVEK